MQRYYVFYASNCDEAPVVEGLDAADRQRLLYAENWTKIEQSGLLDGLAVHNKYDTLGTCVVSGSPIAVEKLKTFLTENNIGDIIENIGVRNPDGVFDDPTSPMRERVVRWAVIFLGIILGYAFGEAVLKLYFG